MPSAQRKPATTAEIIERHSNYIDDMVSSYLANLQRIIAKASAKVSARLSKDLDTERDGKLKLNTPTLRRIRGLNGELIKAANEAGSSALSQQFADSFAGQLPYFLDIVKVVADRVGEPLRVRFNADDRGVFAKRQAMIANSLDGAVEMAATRAVAAAQLNIGALPFRDLVGTLAETFSTSALQARTLAASSQSIYFREIASRGYQKIADAYGSRVTLRYRYEGPDDKLTRPFCDKVLAMMDKRGPLTREQIDKLDNEESVLSDAWLHCGGYNCRHQWVLDEVE